LQDRDVQLDVDSFNKFQRRDTTLSKINYSNTSLEQRKKVRRIMGLIFVFVVALGAPFVMNMLWRKLKSVISKKMEEVKQSQMERQMQRKGQVVALYDFNPRQNSELKFCKGDVLDVFNTDPSGWWEAELNGKFGLIPYNYVVDVNASREGEEPMKISEPDEGNWKKQRLNRSVRWKDQIEELEEEKILSMEDRQEEERMLELEEAP